MKYFSTVLIILLFWTVNILAQTGNDGTLDQTFGNNGIQSVNFDLNRIHKQIILPDNKIIVLGSTFIEGIRQQYSLIKFNEDGTFDNTFGVGGVVNLPNDFNDPDTLFTRYDDVVMFSDGKFLLTQMKDVQKRLDVVPPYDSVYSRTKSSILRYNQDGSSDVTFGNNGIIMLYDEEIISSASVRFNYIYSVTVRSDDSFLLTTKHNRTIYQIEAFLHDGERDISFGNNGIIDRGNDWNYEIINAMDNDFFLITADDINWLVEGNNFQIQKYSSNGMRDFSYGTSGVVSLDTTFWGNKYVSLASFDLENNDLFLLFKRYENDYYGAAVVKILAEGAVDYSFGTEGIKEISCSNFGTTGDYFPSDIMKMPHDIIVAGSLDIPYNYGYSSKQGVFLSKLLPDGSFNSSFGNNGLVDKILRDGESTNLPLSSSGLRSDYKIQTTFLSGSDSLFLVRYNNSRSFSSIHVSGDVSGFWNEDTIFVDGDITIPEDSSLLIDPGTVVFFTGAYKFVVYGQLTAEGTEGDSILFDAPDEVLWKGIGFLNTRETGQATSKIKYCNLTKVGSNTWSWPTLYFLHSTAMVSDTKIYNSYGISLINADGTIERTSFINTSSVYLDSSSTPVFTSCDFDSSGISINNSSPIIDSCVVENSWNGGGIVGIYGNNSSPIIKNTIIRNNTGGVSFSNSSPILKFVTIENNHTNGYGGGGHFSKSNPVLTNVVVKGNTANLHCGGLFFTAPPTGEHYTAELNNCLIVKDSVMRTDLSDALGGGVVIWGKYIVNFNNCTIADNVGKDWAGILTDGNSEAYLNNSIVWNNGNNLDFQASGLYTYSIIQGNYVGQDTASTNLDNVDPLFRDAANGDYHLQSSACGYNSDSPAIDAGDPNIGDFLLDCETAGLGGISSDIGAYGGVDNWWEHSINPACYYSGDVSGVWDCDTVHIIGDVLVPSGKTLTITENVKRVYITGPYQIKVEGAFIARGPDNDRTDLNGDRILFTGSNWHGIYFSNTNDRNEGTSVIENCRFDYCDKMDIPYQGGGAVLISNSDSVIIKHSVFYNNKAKFGGAMMIDNSDAIVSDCYFENNGYYTNSIQTEGGGAIYVKNSNPILHKLKLIGNKAVSAGAILFDNSAPVVTNILAVKNTAQNLAGAIHVINSSSPKFVNATISDNTAAAGGAFYLNPNTSTEIINSIMYGDTKPEIYLDGGMANVTYTLVDSGSTESWYGVGCLDENPQFKMTIGNYYYLSSTACSDGVNSHAIDAGHPDSLDAVLDCEQGLGTSRADMGYYGGRYSDFITDVKDNITNIIPTKYSLLQNYPNPFNPSTTIQFALPKTGLVSLKVYNILGEEVATLINREMNAGFQSIVFDASRLSSGIYFYKIKAGNFTAVKKMILMK